jgi:hypothetical protein
MELIKFAVPLFEQEHESDTINYDKVLNNNEEQEVEEEESEEAKRPDKNDAQTAYKEDVGELYNAV